MTEPAEIHDLVGAELSGVCFVRSYVEFHFDGPILRSLAAPTIARGERVVDFPSPGSRDALCELIGSAVLRVDDRPDDLVLELGSAEVRIPKASPGAGPEVAHFVPTVEGRLDGASMWIWENLVPTRSTRLDDDS